MSALKKLSDRFGHLDSAHGVNKFSLILILVIFAAIPVTVFTAITLRQINPQAATGQPDGMLPTNGSSLRTLQPTFSWNCYCYTTSYRIYLNLNGNFYSGTWYKDVSGTTADWGGWQSASMQPFPGFQTNVRYYWAVACTPGKGGCTTSATQSFVTDISPPSIAPYLKQVTGNNIYWNAGFDVVGIARYIVYRSQNGGNFSWACESFTTTCIDNQWEGALPTTYFVRAFDAAWNSKDSNYLSFTTPDKDFDNDGFLDSAERWMGTNVKVSCGPNAWPPDINSDSHVNDGDIQTAVGFIGSKNLRYDADKNGFVNFADVLQFAKYNGKSC